MKAKLYIFALVSMALCAQAFALSPAAGLWWNPQESGRGYTIDQQDNVMIVTAYVYDGSKKATWFLASGVYSNSSNSFSSTLGAYSGGQCFGCPYTSPTPVAAGAVSIQFTSPETAVLSYPGGQTNIQHEIYAYPTKQDYLFGEWSLTNYISGLLDTEWVIFNSTFVSSSGVHYVSGAEEGRSGTVSLGQYTNGIFIVITGDSSFDEVYEFDVASDDRRMLGHGAIFPAGGTIPTNLQPAAGSRLLFKSELGGQLAAKALQQPDERMLEQMAEKLEAM